MIGRTSVLLSMLLMLSIVFTPIESSPTQKNAVNRSPLVRRQTRTFGSDWFGSSNWPYFRQIWRLPTFTLASIFDDEHDSFHKRISDLENGQRRIMGYIRKLQADKNANDQSIKRVPTPSVAESVVPTSTSSSAAEFAPEPQTPTTASTATFATADDSAVKPQQEEQQVVVTTAAATKSKDEEVEAVTTINKVTEEISPDKAADQNVETVTESMADTEELVKVVGEQTTLETKIDSDEDTNDVFV